MAKTMSGLALAALFALSACGGAEGPPPEDFALRVARCVAQDDWSSYRELALARAPMLATDSNPTATRQTFQSLAGAEERAIRRDFDRAVRSQVLEVDQIQNYRAVVFAAEPDRWVLHIHDASNEFTGLEMTLVRSGDGYRVATLFAR